ncbi:MAG: hypothetical protein ACX939_08955 [Hyphococcus sp.]
MALIIDFMLLAASGTACFYCWVLSKRLKALTSNKDGIQTGIAALAQSAEEMQTAIAETKESASENVSRLEALIAEANAKAPELEELLTRIAEVSKDAVSETEGAARSLVDILTPHIEDAKTSANLLLQSLEQAQQSPAPTPKKKTKATAKKRKISDDGLDIEFVLDDEEEDQAA